MKLLEEAYGIVNEFRRYNPLNRTFNEFPLKDYRVPRVSGIHYGEYGKGIDKVKPNTLKHIIYHLHDADTDMIFEAMIVLFYYYKIKKNNTKQMRIEYKELKKHYRVKHDEATPLVTVTNNVIIYSISFNVGSTQINKFGLATDTNRYKKMVSDAKSHYMHISVGNFKVNQEIEFDTLKQAEAFEKEAIINLKKHIKYEKCKFFFDGYTESYLHII